MCEDQAPRVELVPLMRTRSLITTSPVPLFHSGEEPCPGDFWQKAMQQLARGNRRQQAPLPRSAHRTDRRKTLRSYRLEEMVFPRPLHFTSYEAGWLLRRLRRKMKAVSKQPGGGGRSMKPLTLDLFGVVMEVSRHQAALIEQEACLDVHSL